MAKDLKRTKPDWRDIPHSWLLMSKHSEKSKEENDKYELIAALQDEDFKIEILNAAVKN